MERSKLIPQEVHRIIDRMTSDLKAYRDSGKAFPDVVSRRERDINALVDAFNQMEEEHVKVVAGLKHDLQHVREVVDRLLGVRFIDFSWSYLEGSAQSTLEDWRARADREENRSMSTDEADRLRRDVKILQEEFDELYDENVALMMHVGEMNDRVQLQAEWMILNGVDHRLPAEMGTDKRMLDVFKQARMMLAKRLTETGEEAQLFTPGPERSKLAHYLLLHAANPNAGEKYQNWIKDVAEHSVK